MTKPTQTLYLAYLNTRSDLDELDIKHQKKNQFFGAEFTFTVIGSSHYIKSEELGFHELLSCKPINEDLVKTLPLDMGIEQTVKHETEDFTVKTVVRGEPLDQFPDPETFDIAYRFGPDAYTTINCLSNNTYETYHTYPEHDLALYTKNRFTAPSNSRNEAHRTGTTEQMAVRQP